MTVSGDCSVNAAGLTWEATAYVFHISIALLLLRAIYTSYKSLGKLASAVFLAVAAAEIVFQAGFTDVVRQAQACAGDDVWRDGSSVWLFNVPFAFIWLGAAAWGILAFTAPGSLTSLSLPQKIGQSPVLRALCFLPGLGSVYAVTFLVGGGTLMKPRDSHLYWFEPFLATVLTLSGFTWLAIATQGAKLIKQKTWSKIPFSRVLAAIIALSAAYYCVWRLNGGLILSSEQWSASSPIRRAFESANLDGETHQSWQHVEFLRKAASAVGVPFLIKV